MNKQSKSLCSRTLLPCTGNSHMGSKTRPKLFDFAYFPMKEDKSWTEILAGKAAPELWTLKKSNQNNDILFKYIVYSFERLLADGQVIESSDRAAFHTGLFTSNYEPIYAYFVPNRIPGQQKWCWKGFYCPNEGRTGKEMSSKLDLSRAGIVRWFKNPAKLYCNPALLMPGKLDIDIQHCVVDNAYRLPVEVLRKIAADDKRILEALDAKYDDEREKRASIATAIRNSSDFANILEALKGQIENAIQLACRKIQCDYAAAVPQYYPDHGPDNDGFGHLIPLSFDRNDIESVDCVLVVQSTSDGTGYHAATILTPDMAYSDARLLRKPDVHWLVKQLKTGVEK